jgi:hypothetical protein
VTVPHGLRPGWERDEACRQLVDRAALTDDGRAYAEILRSIEDWCEWDVFAGLLSTRLAVSPAALPHRRAKQEALGRERARRRHPSAPA